MKIKFLVIAVVVVFIVTIYYQVTSVRIHLDSTLESAMIKQGYDLNNDAKIDRKDMDAIRTLALGNAKVESLNGLSSELNPKMKSIYLAQIMGLNRLDLSVNGQVTDLRLVSCEIGSIDRIIGGENLVTLSISDAGIRNISGIKRFGKLEVLSLDHNQITDISPLKELMYLNTLDLRGNPITDYTIFRESRNLRRVTVSQQQYETIATQIPASQLNLFDISE